MALLTQADLEAVLFRDFTNNPDPVVAQLLAQAESIVDGYAGRPLESASYTIEVDGHGGDTIRVGRWPITAVTSVTVDGDVWTVDVDYKWRPDGRFVALGAGLSYDPYTKSMGGYWPVGTQNIELVFTAGYVTPPFGYVPIAIQIAKRLYTEGAGTAASPDGIVQQSVGGESVTYQWQNQPSQAASVAAAEKAMVEAMPWGPRRAGTRRG